MTISELIEKLEAIRDKEGDLNVLYTSNDDEYGDTMEDMDDGLLTVKDVHVVRKFGEYLTYADNDFGISESYKDENGRLCARTIGTEPGVIRRYLAIGDETNVYDTSSLKPGDYTLDID